jgi:Polymer-forming cytoskeletal
MPHQPTKGDKQTLIEQGTEFKGTMKSTCPVVVNGLVEGDLTAPELDVTATGTVRGNIKANRLSSRGMLSGNIDASDLFLSGSVGSKTVIKAKNLEVKLAPDQGRMELTFGECTLDIGDEPTKERRLDASAKPTSMASQSTSQLPVTKSLPPASGLTREEMAVLAPGTAAPLEAANETSAEAKDKDLGDSAKSTRAGSGGFSISKPPAKKVGARDSVPPGS